MIEHPEEDEPAWRRELREQARCRRDPWVVLEGRRAVETAMTHWWDIRGVVIAEECEWRPPEWSGLELRYEARAELDGIAGHAKHRGVIGLARQPEEFADVAGLFEELGADALVVVCPRVADPADAGAVVRTAAALGAEAVVFGDAGASPFERGAVKSSRGALFRVPVRVADAGQVLRCLKAARFELVGADAEDDEARDLDGLELGAERVALVVSDRGLGSFWLAACDEIVRIPLASGDESMSAASASAVCLWEIQRLRAETEA